MHYNPHDPFENVLRAAFASALKYHTLYGSGVINPSNKHVWKHVLAGERLAAGICLNTIAGDIFASLYNETRASVPMPSHAFRRNESKAEELASAYDYYTHLFFENP